MSQIYRINTFYVRTFRVLDLNSYLERTKHIYYEEMQTQFYGFLNSIFIRLHFFNSQSAINRKWFLNTVGTGWIEVSSKMS